MDTLITVVDPNGARTDHRFSEEPITLGSAIANHLVCEEPEIAPHQLIIFRDRGRWMLRNLGPGARLTCGSNPVEPGSSLALPAECEVTVGCFGLQWYAEAPPEGVRREFGAAQPEPDVQPEPPPGRTRVVSERSGSVEGGQLRSSGGARVIASRPVGGAPEFVSPTVDEPATPMPELDALFGETIPPGPPSRSNLRPSATPPPPLTKTFKQPSPLAGVEPLPSPPPLRPDPVKRGVRGKALSPRLPSPGAARSNASETRATVAFNGFGRMRVARVHEVVVEIADADGLRVVPCFPGCAVTPTAARVETAGNVVFEVTPIATGRFLHAGFDVIGANGRPSRFELPFRVVNTVVTRMSLWLGVVAVIAAWAALRNRWDLVEPFRSRLGTGMAASIDEGLATIGGTPGVLIGIAGLCVLVSLLGFLRARPRPIRVNAQPV